MKGKSYKTCPLYKKVEHHNMTSSFSKMIRGKPSEDWLKVRMAAASSHRLFAGEAVLDPCPYFSFNFLKKNSPIVNKLKHLSLLDKNEIHHRGFMECGCGQVPEDSVYTW